MSYEGYVELLCGNGHRYTGNCYDWVALCPTCQSEEVSFICEVDQTNCNDVGLIPEWEWEKFKMGDKILETCNLGYKHVIKEATFRVPTPEEKKKIQYYVSYVGIDPKDDSHKFHYVRLHDNKKFTKDGKEV